MTVHEPLLALHIASGAAGLLLGPLAFRASKRRGGHTSLGEAYHWVMAAVCVSAAGLAIIDWSRIWWFLPIAAFSYANALVGYVAARRRRPGWLPWHVRGMCGSYVALLTALLVVNTGGALLVAWFIPAIVGTPLIEWLVREVKRGRRPKRAGGARRRCPDGMVSRISG